MKHLAYKPALFILALACTPLLALAHEYSNTLGIPASATDYHQVNCPDDTTDHLYFSIKSTGSATAPIVSAQVSKDLVAMAATDPSNTDKAYSAGFAIAKGAGAYHITISKSKLGKAKYTFQYHCQTINNDHPETRILTIEHKR